MKTRSHLNSTPSLLERQAEWLKRYRPGLRIGEQGNVVSVGDGIARIHGLDKVMAGELLEFEGGVVGMVLNSL